MVQRSLKFYWDMTQLVKENTNIQDVKIFLIEHDLQYQINLFKTSKDEVLQLYDDTICYTIIGGSSADKKEWRSNFHVGKLVDVNGALIHEGFHSLAVEVLEHEKLVKRDSMIWDGHSRGAAAVSVICWITKEIGFGDGTPKAFKNWVDVPSFTNVCNPLDPVCHVVPFFKRVGNIVKVIFLRRPHTQYGKHLNKVKK